jgi:two-component system sensor histidine kinase GlrK
MRLRRPRTLLSLTLVGVGLVTLPLLIGVGNAFFTLNKLMYESAEVVRASADSTRETERMARALTNMRRYARQYVALDRDPRRLDFYRDSAYNLTLSLDAVAAQDRPADVDAELAIIGTISRALSVLLTDYVVSEEIVTQELDAMAAAADHIDDSLRDMIGDRLATLQQETQAARRALALQAAALIPGIAIVVLLFLLLVGRPMRQVDRAIAELGKGDFSRSIAVSGPTDIETLGDKLEWLRLRLAESTEEKNRFLRHMSHELKTPLANIREGTELLLDGAVGTLDRQQQEVTGILRENSVKLQRLIENLLTFSAWQAKTASLAISEFELKPLVFSVLSQHRLVISSREIKLRLDVAPIKVRADEGKLRLVLENLLSNAIKFTQDHGAIAVRAQMDGSELVIEVADSGPGVAPEDTPRIFEAFYQGRRLQGGPVGGTGIGLSVVNECVQAHGGTVLLADEALGTPDFSPGGAHFVVRLPLRRADDRPMLAVANG